jgi:hypothetical protein
MIPQLGFMFVINIFGNNTLETLGGCVVNYPHSLLWYWFVAVTPINVLFSSIFSYVAYKQYQLYGTDAWRRLARDGIQTMCSVIACNVICRLILLFEIGGNFSEQSFVADW